MDKYTSLKQRNFNENKFGNFSIKQNIKQIKHTEKCNHLVNQIEKELHNHHNCNLDNNIDEHDKKLKLKSVLAEIIDKYSDKFANVVEEIKPVIEDTFVLELDDIYKTNQSDEQIPKFDDQYKEPKLKSVVQLAWSKSKLDQIIKSKKW